jgi:hypothetical protein
MAFSCSELRLISPVYLFDIAIIRLRGPHNENAIIARSIVSIRAGFILKKISFSRSIETAPSTNKDEPVDTAVLYIVEKQFRDPEAQRNIKANHCPPYLVGNDEDKKRQ